MDSYVFNHVFEEDVHNKSTRSKPVKRKWREIEALKERNRLRRELQEIDLFAKYNDEDCNF